MRGTRASTPSSPTSHPDRSPAGQDSAPSWHRYPTAAAADRRTGLQDPGLFDAVYWPALRDQIGGALGSWLLARDPGCPDGAVRCFHVLAVDSLVVRGSRPPIFKVIEVNTEYGAEIDQCLTDAVARGIVTLGVLGAAADSVEAGAGTLSACSTTMAWESIAIHS